ncbi:MAG: Hsp20/alpha crystallin family protein [Candidatus Omnitrophica bacterium]|nr:Hsp20/alpha crystallin family protein [Candidatus Omnitrophota bacterium]
MKLVQYQNNPFSLLDDLQNEINKLFSSSVDHYTQDETTSLSPRIDISEDENKVYIDVDLPGFDQKDINVKIKGDTLAISAKKDTKKEEKKKHYYRCERFQGNFYRALALPKTVDPSKIEATHKKGVLAISIPKREEEKEKEISVNVQ